MNVVTNHKLYDIVHAVLGHAVDGPFHSYDAAAKQADVMNRIETDAGRKAKFVAKERGEFSRESVRIWNES